MGNKCFLMLLLVTAFLTVSCDYARMRDQESVRTYEKQMPSTPENTIPVDGGYQNLALARPESIRNPLAPTPASIERGRRVYAYFCIQCHGPRMDGYGTVGQSFAPLPADLRSPQVLGQADGEIYRKIRMGFRKHPALFTTVSDGDTWAFVNYLRTLGGGQRQ